VSFRSCNSKWDVFDEKTAKQIIEYTQSDGLMIGRAAIGNPFIFRKISHYLENGEILPPQETEKRLADFFEYMELCRNYGMLTYNDLKRNAQWFTKGMENVKQVRVKINQTEDIDSIIGILKDILRSRTTNFTNWNELRQREIVWSS